MNKRNYQKELEKTLLKIKEGAEGDGARPSLFLHSCCAPCSSYVLEYLSQYFSITVFYYNPNISPQSEFEKRLAEEKRLLRSMPFENPVDILEGHYDYSEFLHIAKGLEDCPEGGERCFACYALRLSEAARTAAEGGYDYFTTTLSISPLKNAGKLNAIGEAAGERYGVRYLPSDFKKKGGYQRSIELSREYGLYRQDYCGCVFSKAEREGRSADSGKKDEDAGGNIEK